MPFDIEADGPYYSVLDFFARLGRLSRIINVGDLKLNAIGGVPAGKFHMTPGTSVTGTFTITTFFTNPAKRRRQPAGCTGRNVRAKTMKLAKTSAKSAGSAGRGDCACARPRGPDQAGKDGKKAPKANGSAAPAKRGREAAPASATKSPAVRKAETRQNKRDPFLPLSQRQEGKLGRHSHLPPGKAGLVIATVRVDGAVRSGRNDRSGFQPRTASVFRPGGRPTLRRRSGKDWFGRSHVSRELERRLRKPVERVVTKRIYASAGEQQ